ncbi:hypothetical protein TGMAS_415000 [Toxoplasma gondii MAS]|uniref:Uncharacterized protein n=1 Tax=Toxoplasma gondii MAS TaxID=943118 RepID=A0A086QG92_TOXGO|nr:hypothetical protein TGMAS_415000 [Toxoplasma gondii MAS]
MPPLRMHVNSSVSMFVHPVRVSLSFAPVCDSAFFSFAFCVPAPRLLSLLFLLCLPLLQTVSSPVAWERLVLCRLPSTPGVQERIVAEVHSHASSVQKNEVSSALPESKSVLFSKKERAAQTRLKREDKQHRKRQKKNKKTHVEKTRQTWPADAHASGIGCTYNSALGTEQKCKRHRIQFRTNALIICTAHPESYFPPLCSPKIGCFLLLQQIAVWA